jgi:hypothetical protein
VSSELSARHCLSIMWQRPDPAAIGIAIGFGTHRGLELESGPG